jgi:hypothetical protein
VQHEIEQRLAQKAIEPQAIVTITNSLSYAATVRARSSPVCECRSPSTGIGFSI